MTSLDSIVGRLRSQGGRGFTSAVLDAFRFLGFEVEDIEETQGTQAHSDLIVKAPLATDPYFAVLECTAVREGSEISYQKLYQLGSNFDRYLTRYSKSYPSASYKMLVGRPSFSTDTIKLAKKEVLMSVETLVTLLNAHERCYLSQDELERIFQHKGEITPKVLNILFLSYLRRASLYAWIYWSLLKDATDKSKGRKKEWTNIKGLIAVVKQWGWFLVDAELQDSAITDAITDLSSPVVRALLFDGQNVMLSSLPFEKIVQNMGDLGKSFENYLGIIIKGATRAKERSKT